MTPNRQAFLDMLAVSEGTAHIGDRGYNCLVGGGTFDSYDDHPRRSIRVRPGLWSTAAGRYQLLARWYDPYCRLLKLRDFSPASQDAIALQQIRECGALSDIDAGRFDVAVQKCAHIWASLPGAGYQQHENSLTDLRNTYTQAGGSLSA